MLSLPSSLPPATGGDDGTVRIWAVGGAPSSGVTAIRVDGDVWGCAWFPGSTDLCIGGNRGLYRYRLWLLDAIVEGCGGTEEDRAGFSTAWRMLRVLPPPDGPAAGGTGRASPDPLHAAAVGQPSRLPRQASS